MGDLSSFLVEFRALVGVIVGLGVLVLGFHVCMGALRGHMKAALWGGERDENPELEVGPNGIREGNTFYCYNPESGEVSDEDAFFGPPGMWTDEQREEFEADREWLEGFTDNELYHREYGEWWWESHGFASEAEAVADLKSRE